MVGERLWDRWSRLASQAPDAEAIVHWRAEADPVRWTRGGLLVAAAALAERLRGEGVVPGEVCAIVLRHDPMFYPLYLAISKLGAIPAVLAYPNSRIHPDKFVHGLRGMAQKSGLRWMMTERALEPTLQPLVLGEHSTVKRLLFPLEWSTDLPGSSATATGGVSSDPCLLQHSSGTTGLQKAVVLSHDAVLGHVDRYAAAIGLTERDRVASWLPLYHDMGLIAAFHLPLARGVASVQLDPFEWIAAPYLLMDVLHRERCTTAWLPNFAFNLLADRVVDDDLADARFEHVRLLVNCSEPVRADSHARFAGRYESRGLRASSLAVSYAMAETTFAVTQTRPEVAPRTLAVDRDALRAGRVVPTTALDRARLCVSCGVPIDGCEVRILDGEGRVLPDGGVGEICVTSASLFSGYRNDPEKTDAVLRDGWYRTGDIGFRDGGEYFVIGREKDLIIVAGKNLYPEDIEDAVGAVPGVVPGRVVAFGYDEEDAGTEAVAVIVEARLEGDQERQDLKLAILRAAMAIDVTIRRVYLAPPRWLVKSSSGKPSRKANRDRLLAGELNES